MRTDELRWQPDVAEGEWIAPRLGPFGAQVGSVVPRGFEAYARVLHPVSNGDGPDCTWAEVCACTGRRAHALMQWDAIAGVVVTVDGGVTRRTAEWSGADPDVGNLGAAALATLLDVLAGHTDSGAECFFALWEGYGWIHGSPAVAVLGSSEPVPPAYPAAIIDGPRLRHPHRDHILFAGPLPAASQLGHHLPWGTFAVQSPNLFWPADRSWCVASEIDFDSTLVGGSTALVDAVLAAPGLEAWPVDPGDSLASDRDMVNI